MLLENVDINCVRDISRVHFKLPKSKWMILVGESSTTVLQAIALCLRSTRPPTEWPKGAFTHSWGPSTIFGDCVSEVECSFSESGRATLRISSGRFSQDWQKYSGVTLLGYGSGRRVGTTVWTFPVGTLFSDSEEMTSLSLWLSEVENRNFPYSDAWNEAKRKVCSILGVHDIFMSDFKVWVVKKEGQTAKEFGVMNSGFRSLAGLLINIVSEVFVRKYSALRSKLPEDTLSTAEAIVLIDNLELHLSPRQQVGLVEKMREAFPNMTFIVSTNSPVILGQFNANEVTMLVENEHDGHTCSEPCVGDPRLHNAAQIYDLGFDTTSMPSDLARSLSRARYLLADPERTGNEQNELDDLKAKLLAAGVDF